MIRFHLPSSRIRHAVLLLAATAATACFGDDGGEPGDAGSPREDGGTPDVDGSAPEPDGGTAVPGVIERYIRADTARLVLEVDHVPGEEPPAGVRDRLARGLGDVVDKPEGVEVTIHETVESRGSDHAWTEDELRDLAHSTFDLAVPDDAVAMHAVFVDGSYAADGEDRTTLGLAFDRTQIIIFQDRIDEACEGASVGPLLRDELCDNTLSTVLTHEVGHLLGLVDAGLPMQTDHRDEEHGHHDDDRDCVMYWTVETARIADVLAERLVGGGRETLGFGDDCLADVAAVRDR